MRSVDLTQEAILVWLPKGENATVSHFSGEAVEQPPAENPDTWWTGQHAVEHVGKVLRDHDKLPWIRIGDEILGPDAIAQFSVGIRAMKKFE